MRNLIDLTMDRLQERRLSPVYLAPRYRTILREEFQNLRCPGERGLRKPASQSSFDHRGLSTFQPLDIRSLTRERLPLTAAAVKTVTCDRLWCARSGKLTHCMRSGIFSTSPDRRGLSSWAVTHCHVTLGECSLR